MKGESVFVNLTCRNGQVLVAPVARYMLEALPPACIGNDPSGPTVGFYLGWFEARGCFTEAAIQRLRTQGTCRARMTWQAYNWFLCQCTD